MRAWMNDGKSYIERYKLAQWMRASTGRSKYLKARSEFSGWRLHLNVTVVCSNMLLVDTQGLPQNRVFTVWVTMMRTPIGRGMQEWQRILVSLWRLCQVRAGRNCCRYPGAARMAVGHGSLSPREVGIISTGRWVLRCGDKCRYLVDELVLMEPSTIKT